MTVEFVAQHQFDDAMDLERLRQCMDKLCDAIGEPDWEGATDEIIRRAKQADEMRTLLRNLYANVASRRLVCGVYVVSAGDMHYLKGKIRGLVDLSPSLSSLDEYEERLPK